MIGLPKNDYLNQRKTSLNFLHHGIKSDKNAKAKTSRIDYEK